MTASIFPFFELYKMCRLAVCYDLQEQFSYISATRSVFKLLSYYTKPLNDLPESLEDRINAMFSQIGNTYRLYMRYSAAYPDFIGMELSKVLYDAPCFADFLTSYDDEGLKQTAKNDFPGVSSDFFANARPHIVLTPHKKREFDNESDAIRWIASTSLKKETSKMPLLRFEDFLRVTNLSDMRHSAMALEEYKRSFAQSDLVFIPEIDWIHTSKHILTYAPFEEKEFRLTVNTEKALVYTIAQMILKDGFFMVFLPSFLKMTEDERLILVSHASDIRLSKKQHAFVLEFFDAFLKKDFKALALAIIKAGMTTPELSPVSLTSFCTRLYEEIKECSPATMCGLAIEALGKMGVSFPIEIRMIYMALLSIECLSGDKDIWEFLDLNDVRDWVSGEKYVQAQEEQEPADTVEEITQHVLSVPPVAEGLQEVRAAKKASFVRDPDLVAKMIVRHENDSE